MPIIYILSAKTAVQREKVNCCCDENIGWWKYGVVEREHSKAWKRNRKRNENTVGHGRRVERGARKL
jgi:hypothetical protein